MTLRLEYRTLAPQAISALAGLNTYSDSCSVAPAFRRLLEVLVSRINHCSYCQQTHERQYLVLGESAFRLDELSHWLDSDAFSIAEKAAFAWAESVTRISTEGAPDELYQALQAHYTELEIVDLTFIVLAMNAWNRLAISFAREADNQLA